MSDSRFDIVSVFKFEKRLRIFVAVYLSAILLLVGSVLIIVDMPSELQQVLVVILGLIAIATIDAFRKASEDTSSLPNKIEQIIVQNGGFYVDGNYYINGDINQGRERKQSLAESAAEIQALLKQLELSNSPATEEEQLAYFNEETPPDLKSRVASAVQSGGGAALATILDASPYGNIAKAAITGWLFSDSISGQETKSSEQ